MRIYINQQDRTGLKIKVGVRWKNSEVNNDSGLTGDKNKISVNESKDKIDSNLNSRENVRPMGDTNVRKLNNSVEERKIISCNASTKDKTKAPKAAVKSKSTNEITNMSASNSKSQRKATRVKEYSDTCPTLTMM